MLLRSGVRGVASLTRGGYKVLADSHVNHFEKLLGPDAVLTADIDSYNTDWNSGTTGKSEIVLRPKNVQEVSDVMKFCFKENLAVVPQGGNTGIVGGSVPVFDEVVVSMSRMNSITEIDEINGTVTCEAGCVLETVQEEIGEKGLMSPYDLGSKGSCQIGGNISTCAGGLRLIRYGSLLSNTLGLQVVKANGEILDCLNKLRKDNTGYHLRQMFIGAEGTLGVVTAATIQCPPRPNAVNLAFLGLESYKDVLSTIISAREMLCETVSAIEMIDSVSLDISMEKLNQKRPFNKSFPFYMVIETQGSNQEHDNEKMNTFLEKVMKSGIVKDGILSDAPSTIKEIWKIRESLAEGLKKNANLYTYDVTLPLDCLYDIVTDLEKYLAGLKTISVSGYGHIGDGNIHVNVRSKKFDQDLLDKIEPFIYKWTMSKKGSISSEHGIGLRKTKYLHLVKPSESINLMRSIKRMMDPKLILNPYKLIYPV